MRTQSMFSRASKPSIAAISSKIQPLLKMLLVASFGFTAQLAMADGLAVAEKGGCLTCHAMYERKVGPSFIDVANRYKDQEKYKDQDVEQLLINKIKTGGRGNWGVLPMPANAGKLSDEEFKLVVEWIRSL